MQENIVPQQTPSTVPALRRSLDAGNKQALEAAVERCRLRVWLWAWRSESATALMHVSTTPC